MIDLGYGFVEEKNIIEFSKDALRIDTTRGISKENFTREQILLAMNSVHKDLQFTMETHRDFNDGRLPTLSFSLWPGQRGIHHSYYQEEMRNQVLVMKHNATGRQALMYTMCGELIRRLQVVDERLPLEEMINVVEKYVH